jgi:hypothetical protein
LKLQAARFSNASLEAFVLELGQVMPESISTMLILLAKMPVQPDPYGMSAYAMMAEFANNAERGLSSPSKRAIQVEIESNVHAAITKTLDYMEDETKNHETCFKAWRDGLHSIFLLGDKIFEDRYERIGLAGAMVDLGAVERMAEGLSVLLTALMVFEYTEQRDVFVARVEGSIYRMSTYCEDYGAREFTEMLPGFQEMRERWQLERA